MAMADLFEFKPGIGPLKLNVVELFRRLRTNDDPVTRVAVRFLRLFAEHGVAISQIQHLLPTVTLDKLATFDALLPALTTDVIEQAAQLFGVQHAWLEGVTERIYEPRFSYREPRAFVEDLFQLVGGDFAFPVRVLYSGKSLDRTALRAQPLALLLAETLCTLGNEEIFRFKVYSDPWDWSAYGCRIQLKALTRHAHFTTRTPVPLYHVDYRVLEEVRDGIRIPRDLLKGPLLTEPSLEDFALAYQESAVAKEVEELPDVLSYMRLHALSC